VRRRAINSRLIAGAVGALVTVIILIIVLSILGWGQELVDIFLCLAALISLIAFGLLGYAAMEVVGLVQEVRGEVKTLVGTANDTMTEVRGTARFVNDTVVTPVTTAAGLVSTTRATLKAFTEPLYKRRS
jgi:hypothetical protein